MSANQTTMLDDDQIFTAIGDLVRSTPETMRYGLIDRLAYALTTMAPEVPEGYVCECGYDFKKGEGYSLDYSTGWQSIVHESDRQWSAWHGDADRHTVTDLLCPDCQRLYILPEGDEVDWC